MADPVYAGVVRAAVGVFRALDVRLDVVGASHVPASGGGVVVINHVSYLDFALAGVPFWTSQRRLVRFMAKESVFRHRVSGPLMRGMRHIPVDRAAGGSSLRTAIGALQAGELVGVFPEATISRSFTLKEFKPGAVLMARAGGVPLVPVTLWGSQRLWTKGRPRDLRHARHVPVAITVGAPIAPKEVDDPAAALRASMQALLEHSQARYPEPPAGSDLWWLPAHLGGSAPTPEAAAALDAAEQVARAQHPHGRGRG
jgi:1-acyl-sn-glycerol-3-phosphate acyltransferase